MGWKKLHILQKVSLAGVVLGSAMAMQGVWRAENYADQNPYRNEPVVRSYGEDRTSLIALKSAKEKLEEVSRKTDVVHELGSLDNKISTLEEGMKEMERDPVIVANKDYFNNKVLLIQRYQAAPGFFMMALAFPLAYLGQKRQKQKREIK